MSAGETRNRSVRVVLPLHLQRLARVSPEVSLNVAPPVTINHLLDALEAAYPMLRGTIREHGSGARRPRVRFFACQQDYSLLPGDTQLPAAVASGEQPFLVIGAIAGG